MIDGSSLIFRAFYGVPQTVKGPSGIPVNAIRGFLDYLARFIAERRPRRLVVATDEDWRPQFRVDAIPSYKTHRTAEPIPPCSRSRWPRSWRSWRPLGSPPWAPRVRGRGCDRVAGQARQR